jgi:hypothetical protein
VHPDLRAGRQRLQPAEQPGEQLPESRSLQRGTRHFPQRKENYSNSITMNHLIFFFENNPMYKNSKHHFKANMLM